MWYRVPQNSIRMISVMTLSPYSIPLKGNPICLVESLNLGEGLRPRENKARFLGEFGFSKSKGPGRPTPKKGPLPNIYP